VSYSVAYTASLLRAVGLGPAGSIATGVTGRTPAGTEPPNPWAILFAARITEAANEGIQSGV